MLNFAIIGASGFIAPRHMKAIKDTQNNLIAVLDPNDSIGIIDSYYPEASYFNEFERFDRHLENLKIKKKINLDYLIICSPNYLHDSHIRYALRSNYNVICEKPIVINPWNLESLIKIEKNSKSKVFTMLQLRLHPQFIKLKKTVSKNISKKKYEVDLTYITSRGKWYNYSWKGDVNKSGGVGTNIGVHFFDILYYVFGNVKNNIIHYRTENTLSGFLELEKAKVRWFLSIDSNCLPSESIKKSQRTYRSIKIDGKEFEFSDGFTELHTEVYKNILSDGKKFRLKENITAINIVSDIRSKKINNKTIDYHPFLKKIKK